MTWQTSVGNWLKGATTALMPSLNANFKADWYAYLRDWLTEVWGSHVQSIPNHDLGIHYFETQRRLIAIRPRLLLIADDFSCPPDVAPGWLVLQEKIRQGHSLNPHLSLGHLKLTNQDGLLNEWGVHHFHLGLKTHPKHPTHVERGDSIVFALVTDDIIRAINVYQHGDWEEEDIVESLHRNWPDAISKYRVRGVTGVQLTNAERRALRKKNCNASIAVADGTVYGGLGGGISGAGSSMESVIRADRKEEEVRQFQDSIAAALDQIIPTLSQRGYGGEEEIAAELRVVDDGFRVFFPKYGVLAKLD